ncbi:MAG: VOC family protein [Verrucomicrobiia bacterium]
MTARSYKPESYNTVSPYLVVPDAAATIEFLKTIFSATELRRFPGPDGKRLMHAEVRIDDSIIMLGDACEGWPATPCHVHVYVADVDAVFQSAIAAGAKPLQQPVKKEDEDKRGGFQDPWGTSWWVATKVA